MTFAEWTVCFCDKPTKGVILILLHQIAVTDVTPTHTVIFALRIRPYAWHLPAASEGHNPSCLSSRRCGKVITGVTVEVATESTGFTSVTVRQSNHKIVIPVVTYRETKAGLYNCRATTLENVYFTTV